MECIYIINLKGEIEVYKKFIETRKENPGLMDQEAHLFKDSFKRCLTRCLPRDFFNSFCMVKCINLVQQSQSKWFFICEVVTKDLLNMLPVTRLQCWVTEVCYDWQLK